MLSGYQRRALPKGHGSYTSPRARFEANAKAGGAGYPILAELPAGRRRVPIRSLQRAVRQCAAAAVRRVRAGAARALRLDAGRLDDRPALVDLLQRAERRRRLRFARLWCAVSDAGFASVPGAVRLSPLAARGERSTREARRVRGRFRESELVEAPPHRAEFWSSFLPCGPLPASGARCAATPGNRSKRQSHDTSASNRMRSTAPHVIGNEE
jgi:hypothetical protein